MAPAEVPEMPSIRSQGSSSSRSSTPQVNAPCAPPPCRARSTRTGSRRHVSLEVDFAASVPEPAQGCPGRWAPVAGRRRYCRPASEPLTMRRARRRGGPVRSRVLRIVKRAALLLAAVVITLLAVRIYDTQRGPPLELWHTYAPPELSADELDEADWSRYLAAEQAAFDDVHGRGHGAARPRGPRSGQPLLRGQPGLSGGTSRRTGTAPTCWSRRARRSARWCSCTG